ncbi:hypothetical protein HanIR_Chr01g0048741 [Helianthus annuus]|nr:hypothetical protein HanIR_Chr01g0048741 [Helianthus annuus]
MRDESQRVIGGFVKIRDWILKIRDEMISDTRLKTLIKMFEVFKIGHWKSNVSFCYWLGLKINVSSDIPTCGCRSVRVNLIRE